MALLPRSLAHALRTALLGVSLALATAPAPAAATVEPPHVERCVRIAAPAPARRALRPAAHRLSALPASRHLSIERPAACRPVAAPPAPRFLAHCALLR
ncbi:MAG: hypothetical protein HZB56_01840 [Deltaproteobacteria bacterium]|nr:hypothetical protein [Deltaproteobacteria bacterium]